MSKSVIFLEYHGQVDFPVIDSLLLNLKKTGEFASLNKITAKRTYALFVECLENIAKHSALKTSGDRKLQPHISISQENDKIIIAAGNPITNEEKGDIQKSLDRINNSDEIALKAQYENKISTVLTKDDKCAGLGLIYMALKSGNKIIYSFNPLTNGYLYFEIKLTLNRYIMRKLIIDQKASSPKVILDPERKIYLISGESRPADVREFYGQILVWLEEFGTHLIKSDDKKGPVIFNFNFDYFNSSSGKLILDICKVLGSLRLKGINISVNWYFEKDDNDMLEAGKEISRIVKFPFEYVESIIN